MKRITTIHELCIDELQDLYSAEKQLTTALPRMAHAVEHDGLKAGFTKHLQQTEDHVKRLEEIAQELAFDIHGKTCQGMKGLIEEGDDLIKLEGNTDVIDTAIAALARKVEHYEMIAYHHAISHIRLLGHTHVVNLLNITFAEEMGTDEMIRRLVDEELDAKASKAR